MRNVLMTLENISRTSSRLHKEELLRHCESPELLQSFLNAALNPYRQFWYKRTPAKPAKP